MDHFARVGAALHADGVPLADIAQRFATPTFVYAHATLRRHVRVLQAGLAQLPHLICYAVKANGNLGILRALGEMDVHFDAVSIGELRRVQAAGLDLSRCIFSGVGKTDSEIEAAQAMGVLYISVESPEELQAVGDIAQARGGVSRVSIRVNPEVDARTHPYIATGMRDNKFGVSANELLALAEAARRHPHLQLVGISCHIGSQVTTLAPFEDAAQRLVALVHQLRDAGHALRHVGIGGGLGIPYGAETPPDPAAYGAAITKILGPLGLEVVLEPGRVLVGNAGVLLSRVVRRKVHHGRTFVLLDAGMNDLLRPALYQAQHRIEAVLPRDGEERVDVVGPVCESADTFVKDHVGPPLHPGDLVVLRSAGAYGFVMSSQYNGRPRAAEVLVDGTDAALVRARETYHDLFALELQPQLRSPKEQP